jgi:hypothetical protein
MFKQDILERINSPTVLTLFNNTLSVVFFLCIVKYLLRISDLHYVT